MEFSRTRNLVGGKAFEKLKNSRVAVFGIGGVGGYCAEALARSGIGTIDLIDSDTVNITNINRQIIATHSSIGEYKVDVMKKRIEDINPNAVVNVYKTFFLPENSSDFDFSLYDYVIDAVDTVTAKLELAVCSNNAGVSLISCMGTGNKLDPTLFEVADIFSTEVCPLAKVMRRELKKRGIKKLKVVYSKEQPLRTENDNGDERIPQSIAFVPSVAGLIIAGEVIKDLIKEE